MPERPVEALPATSHYVPVHPKDRGLARNPDSAAAHAAAMRAVLLHMLADTFDLHEEETMWAGYHLDRILAPLLAQSPESVPFSVRQEMLDGTYTRLLDLRSKAYLVRGRSVYDKKVLQASVEEWADTLMAPIVNSYALRPLDEATIRGQFLGLLRELGVGDTAHPRGATYLPTELRTRIFTDRSRSA